MSTDTDPKTAIPRTAGTPRLVARIRPGWWIHLEAIPGEDAVDGWEHVAWIADTNRGNRRIVFDAPEGAENMVTAHKSDEAVTLTAREAARLGLTFSAGDNR